jgi:hypothetical protein
VTSAAALRTPGLKAIARAMSEAELQTLVIDLARHLGWLVHHVRPAMRQSGGYSTPIQGHKGYPDLTLAKPGRLLIPELKSQVGRCSPEQRAWADALDPYYRLWRPADWLSGVIRSELET